MGEWLRRRSFCLRGGADVGAWVERPAVLQKLFSSMLQHPEAGERLAQRRNGGTEERRNGGSQSTELISVSLLLRCNTVLSVPSVCCKVSVCPKGRRTRARSLRWSA